MTERELDQLEALLGSPALADSALPLDALQGMLCAALSGPRLVAAEAWLPLAIGDTPRFASDAQADEADRLLLRFHDTVAAELMSDAGLSLIVYPIEEGGQEFDFATWSAGYLEGVDLWETLGEMQGEMQGETQDDASAGAAAKVDKEAEQLLLPFIVLSGALDEDPELRAELEFAPSDEAAVIRHWKKNFVDSVIDAHDYWLQRRLTPDTVRREQPKVGRNEPCPCGSGKKYKHCHGA